MLTKYAKVKSLFFLILFLGVLSNASFAIDSECNILANIVMLKLKDNHLTIDQFLKAKKICTKQATEGDPEAQYQLGGLNTVHIDNIYPDESEMWKWMKLSAENGYAKAQSFLGRSYETDNNSIHKKDITLAMKWYIMAAEQHDIASIIRLEEIYRKGLLGIKKNNTKAKFWRNQLSSLKCK